MSNHDIETAVALVAENFDDVTVRDMLKTHDEVAFSEVIGTLLPGEEEIDPASALEVMFNLDALVA